MTPTQKEEIREKIVEIFGLEVAPNGEKDYLLIRDEKGTVLEGTSYAEEVDAILSLLEETDRKARESQQSRVCSVIRGLGVKFDGKKVARTIKEWDYAALMEQKRKERLQSPTLTNGESEHDYPF